jgi:2-oxoglutarate dehydrogenase E2 component (dihydrolipoamide succinyltransferase)
VQPAADAARAFAATIAVEPPVTPVVEEPASQPVAPRGMHFESDFTPPAFELPLASVPRASTTADASHVIPSRRKPKPRIHLGVLLGTAAVTAACAGAFLFIQQRAAGSSVASKPNPAVAAAALRAPAAPPPAEVAADPVLPAAAPAQPIAEPVAPKPEPEPAAARTQPETASAGTVPPYVKAPVVLHRTRLQIRAAQNCHRGGRAVGTAEVFLTFDPSGRVSEARLEGEPIASAPVARCVLDAVRAVRIPKFVGAPFTISESITLR